MNIIRKYLFNQILPNRWLVWFVVISFCVAMSLLGYIQHSFVEMENLSSGKSLAFAHKENSIKIIKPTTYEVVKSPLTILGEARGTWFFEGDFPVRLLDEGGNLIKIAIARAQGDWMTENFVPFFVRIDFDVDRTMNGTLVFQKDNPSGLPEHDFEFALPVILSAD